MPYSPENARMLLLKYIEQTRQVTGEVYEEEDDSFGYWRYRFAGGKPPNFLEHRSKIKLAADLVVEIPEPGTFEAEPSRFGAWFLEFRRQQEESLI